ncbi:Predicted saccharopine dehydrogenase and related protein [gamma proteobacterium HdN1]|nr:Predicted saccharopine dehydrogenase and related protein [gamma proteobacterium HdN1]
MHKMVIIGAGRIGSAIIRLLHRSGRYQLKVVEQNPKLFESIADLGAIEKLTIERSDVAHFVEAMKGWHAVVSAGPFSLNRTIAEAALAAGVSYFDLTEDVETTAHIRKLATHAKNGQIFMPQCGLAPGFIGILAANMVSRFDRLDAIRMRVGALPKYPTNQIRYNLTWSTDGLINEYCNPCDAIVSGQIVQVQALEGLEHISIDGVEYEAFNTSGGLGTLCESLRGKVRALDYKTVRYKGHHYLMNFLIRELQLGDVPRRELLKQLLEAVVPITRQDVVLIFVSASGWRDGVLEEITEVRKIYHQEIGGRVWSSIQITTASSVCAVVDLFFEGKLPQQGFVRQEEVDLQAFLVSPFGRPFLEERISQ